MGTTLSFLPASLSRVSVSPALPLGGRNRGLLLCNTGAVRDSSPHSRVRPVSQGPVCVSVCACRTISEAQQLQ